MTKGVVATVCPLCLCGWYDESKPVGAVCGDTKWGSDRPCRGRLIAAKAERSSREVEAERGAA